MRVPAKHCTKCGAYKALDEFPRRSTARDGRASRCLECNRVYNRAYGKRRHAAGESGYWKKRARLDALKEGKPCTDCGAVFPPYVMQFDHRDPTTKKFTIANAGVGGGWSWASLLAEIAKCDLVCANCHAERTWGPGGTNRKYGKPALPGETVPVS